MIFLRENVCSSFGLLFIGLRAHIWGKFVFKQQVSSILESNAIQQSSSSSYDPFESNNIRIDFINMLEEERRQILVKLNFKNKGIDHEDPDLVPKIQMLSVYIINKAKHLEISSKNRKVKEKKQKSPQIELHEAVHESSQLGNHFIRLVKNIVAVSHDKDQSLESKTKVKLSRQSKMKG
ncbi:MAG: hypothetical protein EZS28_023993 [Streblomastix strix]|uniref:Uncharacterized protein n=1 Tax=Streblomastix strix TaxID=222440 RepID=A0A5J4VDB7_9EUKA|nr:MAG: hypothetical protein EZS28_023993 [Streblomastix strix]